MMMVKPRVRDDDSGENPKWQLRATPLAVKIAIFFAGIIAAVAGIRVVPGGVFVGSAQDVAQLKTVTQAQHEQIMLVDTTHTRQIHAIANEVASVKSDVRLLTENARANTRKNCDELGRRKAESYGFKCNDGQAGLPTP